MVVMCAGGARSAFAVQTLQQLGYTNIVSMDGGFNGWKDAGKPLDSSAARPGGTQPLPASPALARGGGGGQLALLDAKVLLLVLVAWAALRCISPPPGSARLASSTWTRSTNQTCSVRSSTVSTRSVSARSNQPASIAALNPYITVNTYDMRLSADNVLDVIDGYDVIIDGADNFPSRYLNDASVKLGIPVARSDLPFRGTGHRLRSSAGPDLSHMLPEPPPPEFAFVMCGGGRDRGAPRHHRQPSGARGAQTGARHR